MASTIQVGRGRGGSSGPLTSYQAGQISGAQGHHIYIKEKWSDPDWLLVPYAHATSSTTRSLPEASTAQIVFDFGNIKREDSIAYELVFKEDLQNLFVAIQARPSPGTVTPDGASKVRYGKPSTVWVGIIPIEQITILGRKTSISGIDHLAGRQTFQASGLEYLLQRRRVIGAVREHVVVTGEAITPDFDRLGVVPTFNSRQADGTIRGNKSITKIGDGGGTLVTHGFSDDPILAGGELAHQWSLGDILQYQLYWSHEPIDDILFVEPSFLLDGLEGANVNFSDSPPTNFLLEVVEKIDPTNLTTWDIIRKVFSKARGILAQLTFEIDPDDLLPAASSPVYITPFTMTDIEIKIRGAKLPANPRRAIVTLDNSIEMASVTVTNDSVDRYDTVVVQGAPVVTIFSAWTHALVDQYITEADAGGDPNAELTRYFNKKSNYARFVPAWTAAQEAAYEDATDGRSNDTTLNRVFRVFKLANGLNYPTDEYFDWQTAQADQPLDPATGLPATERRNLNIGFDDDGDVNRKVFQGFMNIGKRILPDAYLIKDADIATSDVVEPTIMQLSAYAEYLDKDGTGTDIWMDVSDPPGVDEIKKMVDAKNAALGIPGHHVANGARDTPLDVSPSNTDLEFIISGGTTKHSLARNHVSAAMQSAEAANLTHDYDRLIVTMALRTDVRPRIIVKINNNDGGSLVNRTLTITRDDVQFWHAQPQSVVGTNSIGALRFQAGSLIQRDDRDILANIAALAQAWYSKDRSAVSVTRHGLRRSGFIGTFITSVVFSAGSSQPIGAASPVTEVSHDYILQTTTFTTGLLEIDIRSV